MKHILLEYLFPFHISFETKQEFLTEIFQFCLQSEYISIENRHGYRQAWLAHKYSLLYHAVFDQSLLCFYHLIVTLTALF